jgi:hypothetical protein
MNHYPETVSFEALRARVDRLESVNAELLEALEYTKEQIYLPKLVLEKITAAIKKAKEAPCSESLKP